MANELLKTAERSRASLIKEAVFAALGCTKIDHRSPRKLYDAATQIANFVEAKLAAADRNHAECINMIFDAGARAQTCQCEACRRDGFQHDSGCAVHNGPALPPASCNCGYETTGERQ